jgi:dephospho-CoA kinase
MLRVGLTGGLASGKSLVGRELARLGCHVLSADEIGHEVLLPGGEAYSAVVDEFGREILDDDGQIHRGRLAGLVFNDPVRLEKLNRIVHPAVTRRQQTLAAEIAAREPNAILVVEAAILVETGSYRKFDKLIVVVCRREQQIERALEREGSTLGDVMARLDRQLPLEDKRKVADYVIDTSGTKEETLAQTRQVYESLRSLSA